METKEDNRKQRDIPEQYKADMENLLRQNRAFKSKCYNELLIILSKETGDPNLILAEARVLVKFLKDERKIEIPQPEKI